MRIWKHFILAAAALAGLLPSLFAQETARRPLRILYWNIQNGMWSDQGNNYDNFVAFVRELDPDICIWALFVHRIENQELDQQHPRAEG